MIERDVIDERLRQQAITRDRALLRCYYCDKLLNDYGPCPECGRANGIPEPLSSLESFRLRRSIPNPPTASELARAAMIEGGPVEGGTFDGLLNYEEYELNRIH